MSRWFKFKLDQSIPRKVFSKVDDGTALMSTADYFVHQLDAAFKVADTDDKQQQSTNATSINEFMDNLTADINNANSSKVLAAWDATGRAVRNAAAATRRAPAAAWTATKSAASSVAGAVSGLASRANATRIRVSERIDDSITAVARRIAERGQTRGQTQQGGAPSQGFGGMMAKLKQYVDDDGSAKKIIKPAMLADEYFERLSKIVPDVRRSGSSSSSSSSSSSRPSIFGHPLLLYLPFARAFNCIIYVYTSESGPDTTNYILKYIFRGANSEVDEAEEREEESAHVKQVHEIHILDKNPTDYAFLDEVESYSSRFALLVLSNNNDDD
jgi:hypothetical protein